MKFIRIIVTLLVAVGYAMALPRVPWLAERALASTLVLVILFGLWALVERAWADVAIATAIAAGFAVGKFLLPATDELYLVLVTAAILAFGFLSLALLIGPWSWFFHRRFLRLLKHRRHVGVASLLLAEVHVNIVLAAYYNSQLPLALLIPANVFGATALFIMVLLGLTSWDFAQRKITLPWWNVIHLAGLGGFSGLLWYALRSAPAIATWERVTLLAIASYWLLLTPAVAARFLGRTVNGWKQLHRLVYAAYAAVIIHVWTGVASQRSLMVQRIFWTPVALVVGSHAIGRVMKYGQQRARQRAQPSAVPPPAPTPTANGKA